MPIHSLDTNPSEYSYTSIEEEYNKLFKTEVKKTANENEESIRDVEKSVRKEGLIVIFTHLFWPIKIDKL